MVYRENIVFEYPLQWPKTQGRTPGHKQERSRFGRHNAYAVGNELVLELCRLKAKKIVISTNLRQRTRGDGFYSNQDAQDPGVCVYFELNGQGKAMACDKWKKPEDNLHALVLTIQAIRGLERWGGSGMLEGLFTGFKALGFSGLEPRSSDVRYFEGCDTLEELHRAYRLYVKELHPDVCGDDVEFKEMQAQYQLELERQGGA